jgi:hypothetical protein
MDSCILKKKPLLYSVWYYNINYFLKYFLFENILK